MTVAGARPSLTIWVTSGSSGVHRLRVKVVEVGSRFRIDEEHADDEGLATRGATFLAEG